MNEEICKLAIQYNPLSLKYVKQQTDEICKLAVKINRYVLRYINPELITDEIRLLAIH